jgi:cAMP phosphodiesterase
MKTLLKIYLFLLFPFFLSAQSFDLIPLGIYGGGEENNLSAYLIGEKGKNEFLSLDAGTLRSGIDKAIENGVFEISNEDVLRKYIKGYFISHGHLDHLAGMVINSPEDSVKPIYGTPFTIDILRDYYFTNAAWANFANEGDHPQIGKYTYKTILTTNSFPIEGTNLSAQIFELSHVNPYLSSAILVSNSQGESVLYLGDTGADRIEKTDHLHQLWTAIAPLISNKKLKAILIEVSFDNNQPDDKLFGHLTPTLLNEELKNLAKVVGQKDLKGLKIIVTHLKPGGNRIEIIKKEISENNPMKVDFIFPEQGKKMEL